MKVLIANDKAISFALRLLGFRSRTEHEMRTRLKKKGFEQETINITIDRLREWGYLNDTEYAAAHIRSRQQAGRLKIKADLFQKGIDREIVDNVLDRNFTLESEKKVAEKLVRKMLINKSKDPNSQETQNVEQDQKDLYKIVLRLRNRGFSNVVVEHIIQSIRKNEFCDPD